MDYFFFFAPFFFVAFFFAAFFLAAILESPPRRVVVDRLRMLLVSGERGQSLGSSLPRHTPAIGECFTHALKQPTCQNHRRHHVVPGNSLRTKTIVSEDASGFARSACGKACG